MNNVEMDMNGGLWLRTTSAFAIAAAAGLFATYATSAKAADLGVGGNCCADLEERVAELEATTARKGNRKVRLTVSGQVNETLLFWDDGKESNAYVVTNENSRTRFRFTGDAKINPEWSAGYLLEIGVRAANSANVNQFVDDDTSSTASLDLRHSAWWIESSRLGRVWVGLTSMATDGITEINLSNGSVIGNNDVNNWNGGFFLRSENAVSALSSVRWKDILSSQINANIGEGDRRNLVRYVSPTLHGFTASASWGEDDFGDAALRYAAEFNGVRVAAGVGYQQWSDGNGFFGSQGDRGCANLNFVKGRNGSDVDCNALGLSASAMHVPTGLYVAAAYGKIEDDNTEALFARQVAKFSPTTGAQLTSGPIANADDQGEHWYVQAGVERNFFGPGKSTFYGEYFRAETGANITSAGAARLVPLGDVLNPAGVGSLGVDAFIQDSEVKVWGFGLVQSIDAAAMDLYIGFRNYEADASLIANVLTTVNNNNGTSTTVSTIKRREAELEDFQAVMAGGIIRF